MTYSQEMNLCFIKEKKKKNRISNSMNIAYCCTKFEDARRNLKISKNMQSLLTNRTRYKKTLSLLKEIDFLRRLWNYTKLY